MQFGDRSVQEFKHSEFYKFQSEYHVVLPLCRYTTRRLLSVTPLDEGASLALCWRAMPFQVGRTTLIRCSTKSSIK